MKNLFFRGKNWYFYGKKCQFYAGTYIEFTPKIPHFWIENSYFSIGVISENCYSNRLIEKFTNSAASKLRLMRRFAPEIWQVYLVKGGLSTFVVFVFTVLFDPRHTAPPLLLRHLHKLLPPFSFFLLLSSLSWLHRYFVFVSTLLRGLYLALNSHFILYPSLFIYIGAKKILLSFVQYFQLFKYTSKKENNKKTSVAIKNRNEAKILGLEKMFFNFHAAVFAFFQIVHKKM